ncbi:hypothetical protein BJ123_108137 [Rhodopseudomonas thermotolerans]|uniref:Uncharacterized protein n=2 Tax=Rhodopseudomonas TaxID=1073 RepID=A0A336JMP8_9BRAD|nr:MULTISPECIES: hypothetical protein [Rhodopseudomonas]RED36202.1 hypothetical protein BJ125_108137 [Rhodopseudomonas pentothenatexigens]REG03574.1 hypothetical protein BJ123_108137 [Rhodopseudomonas thermotolerans]SSW90762.1 hypothetical protein SAMN05892882_108137 [Rhodopseudomonas pentothenatexigens]
MSSYNAQPIPARVAFDPRSLETLPLDPWDRFRDAPPLQLAEAERPARLDMIQMPGASVAMPQVIPPLPPGYTLDPPPQQVIPPLPPGYTLDPLPPGYNMAPLQNHPEDAPVANGARPGMFDDLIPQPQQAAPTGGRPGMFDDLIPANNRGPKLIPVDHDPFAQPQPDNRTTLQKVREAIDPVALASSAISSLWNNRHAIAVGAQGVGAGVRDLALMPFDLAAGAQNGVTALTNKAFGTDIPYAVPASRMAEKVLAPYSIPESEMSPGEKLGYNINRFGTQGVGGGTALAMRAPTVAAAVMPSETAGARILDRLSRPYMAAPARTVGGDAVGGAGAGVGVTAAEEYLPKEPATTTGQIANTVATLAAPLIGGVGATAALSSAEGLGGMFRNIAARSFGSTPEIPLNPIAKTPYKEPEIDRAAATLQNQTTGAPRAVAQDIRENAAEFTNPQRPGEAALLPSQIPTAGLLSRDPGLISQEGAARSKNAPDFIERDQRVKETAAGRVNSLRDPEADLGSVFRRAAEARDERLQGANAAVDERASALSALDQARQHQGAEFGVVANAGARAGASQRLDRAVVDEGYVPARAEKNRQFETSPGRAEQLPADEVFTAIDRVRAQNNMLRPDNQVPEDLMQRLEALRPRIEMRDTNILGADGRPVRQEVNVGGAGTATGADLADLRKYIGAAQQRAQVTGNFDLADSLRNLGGAVNRAIEVAPGYAEANANYRQFADRWRPNQADEMARFTQELDRSGNTDGMPNRGSTPPSETAGRFLSSPEKAQTLQRVLAGAPNAQAGQSAVRDYMRSDFAMSAMNPDGTLHPARAAAWERNNADVLHQFPALRTEFDGYVQTARRGQALSIEARNALDEARAARRATELEVDRSAIGTLLREDPRDVAKSLLGGRYGSEKRLDEISALVKNDAQAKRGWKAAVAEVLTDKVRGSKMVGETPEVQFARLAREFQDNEALLAKTFTPEEMNTLRQGHKLLEYFKEAEKRATVGSDTADKWNVSQWVQLAIRHVKGDLAGGGLVKRFKLFLELLPTNKQGADEIVRLAWFNPDVAAYLLERPIKNPNVPEYNIDLRRLEAAAQGARESGD